VRDPLSQISRAIPAADEPRTPGHHGQGPSCRGPDVRSGPVALAQAIEAAEADPAKRRMASGHQQVRFTLMAFGDLAAWAGVLVALGLGFRSIYTSHHAKSEAAEAREVNERMAAAQERMAELMAQRLNDAQAGVVARPAIDWEIEWRGGDRYALRNVGTEAATYARIVADGLVWDAPPDGVMLEPFRSVEFLLLGSLGQPRGHEVMVVTAEEPEPRYVPLPPAD
jgi:hypothetical protein